MNLCHCLVNRNICTKYEIRIPSLPKIPNKRFNWLEPAKKFVKGIAAINNSKIAIYLMSPDAPHNARNCMFWALNVAFSVPVRFNILFMADTHVQHAAKVNIKLRHA